MRNADCAHPSTSTFEASGTGFEDTYAASDSNADGTTTKRLCHRPPGKPPLGCPLTARQLHHADAHAAFPAFWALGEGNTDELSPKSRPDEAVLLWTIHKDQVAMAQCMPFSHPVVCPTIRSLDRVFARNVGRGARLLTAIPGPWRFSALSTTTSSRIQDGTVLRAVLPNSSFSALRPFLPFDVGS